MSREQKSVLDLQRETQAAEALRAALEKIPGMDDETVRDTIEGETSLREIVAQVVALMSLAEAMIDGLDERLAEMSARKKRYVDRRDHLRSMIEQALVIGEIKTLELPDATLTLARRAGGVVIVDETQIPSDYWRKPDPEVDKSKVSTALKDGVDVPGASLGNGSVSLTVRKS